MKILFLGDVVGVAGCSKLTNNLLSEIKSKNIDFVIVNGENAASQGVGLTTVSYTHLTLPTNREV